MPMALIPQEAALNLARAIRPSICQNCLRAFTSTARRQSGHNKWSKIRHDKAANDAKKTNKRTEVTRALTVCSRLYGPNPILNSQLAATIALAKKASVPKATIEAAIARGQGKSSSGTDLESLTIGAIMPPSVALIIDLETESKLRALKEINVMIKKAGGTPTPTKFYFSRVGRVVFEPSAQVSLADDVLDDAIEAGAEDLENDEEGRILVWSQPNRTMEICKAVGEKHALGIVDSTIVWSPNKDTMAALHREADANALAELLGALRKYPEVHAIYSNVVKGTISEERWAAVEANIDV